MKRIFALFLSLLLLVSLFPVLSADAIWEPQDDFYKAHWRECASEQRKYTVSTDTDGVKAPGSDKVVMSVAAGEEVYVLFTYTDKDNRVWGVCEHFNEKGEKWDDFWLPMDKLTKVYDSDDFLSEHKSKMENIPASDTTLYKITGKLPLWNYPGAEEYDCYLTEDYGSIEFSEYNGYTDESGELWVYINYLEGLSGWIYASDPQDLTPHSIAAATPTPEVTPTIEATQTVTATPQATQTKYPSKDNEAALARAQKFITKLIVMSVALVVLVSVLIIVMIVRRSKK